MYQLLEANTDCLHIAKQYTRLPAQPCFGGRVGEALVLSASVLPPQLVATRVVVMAATHSLRLRATRNQEALARAVAAQVCCQPKGASIVAQSP